jgi:hypothetical protein
MATNTTVTAPLEVISDTDQGGLVAILAAFSLSLVLVSLPVRTYARTKMSTYRVDDWAFLCACVRFHDIFRKSMTLLTALQFFSFVQASIVFYEIHIGFGKSADLVDPMEIEPMQKAGST